MDKQILVFGSDGWIVEVVYIRYMSSIYVRIDKKLKFKNVSAYHSIKTVDVDIYDKVFAFDHIKRSGKP